jgi:hypothetical protein
LAAPSVNTMIGKLALGSIKSKLIAVGPVLGTGLRDRDYKTARLCAETERCSVNKLN